MMRNDAHRRGVAIAILLTLLLAACDATTAPPPQSTASPPIVARQSNPPASAQAAHKPSAADVKFALDGPRINVVGNAALVTNEGSHALGSGYQVQTDNSSLVVIIRERNPDGTGTDTVYRISSDDDGFIVVLDGKATMRFTNRQAVVDVTDARSKVVEFRLQNDVNSPPDTAPQIAPTETTIAPTPTDQLVVGSTVQVTSAGLAIHSDASADKPTVGNVLQGETMVIVAGPIAVDGINWWKVGGWDVAGDVGWCNGAFLQRIDPAAQEAERQITVGSTVEVTYEALNIRRAADPNSESLATVVQGQQLTVTGGPVKVDGRNWWQVSGWENLGQQGWASERFLRRVK